MNADQELRRAGDAQQLLDTPIFIEARKDLEKQLAELRRMVAISNTDMHTRLILMEQLSGQFFGYFEKLAQTGKLVRIQLDAEEKRQSLLKQGLLLFNRAGRNAL